MESSGGGGGGVYVSCVAEGESVAVAATVAEECSLELEFVTAALVVLEWV